MPSTTRNISSYKREKRKEIFSKNSYPFFLIVCEGDKTEPFYFYDFPYYKDLGDKDKYGNFNPDSAVKIVTNAGQHKKVIEIAKSEYTKIRKKLGADAVNANDVWCIFDCDYESDEQNRNFNEAINQANKLGFNAIYSIQCFELWYVLHFNYLDSAIHRNQYKTIISQKLGIKYEHETPGMYNKLIQFQQNALKHANRLYKGKELSHDLRSDPITTVHILVLKLNEAYEIIKKDKYC